MMWVKRLCLHPYYYYYYYYYYYSYYYYLRSTRWHTFGAQQM